jgi:ribulose-5-phosphate 4-epimerase/fuculose-1-phosphate aldolase
VSVEAELREEICRIGALMFQRGHVVGSAGNISARLDDGFLITPTDACLAMLDPAKLAKLDSAGQQISGDRGSKTIILHRSIYDADPAAQAVVHSHSPHLVALSLLSQPGQPIAPPLTPYSMMKVGPIPLLPYRRPGAPEVADLVRAEVGRATGVMLQALGPVIWHRSVTAGFFTLEELEETAKLALLLRGQAPRLLSTGEIDELHQVFGDPIK